MQCNAWIWCTRNENQRDSRGRLDSSLQCHSALENIMADYPFGSGIAIAVTSLITILFFSRYLRKSSPYPLPPGPPGEPILGHLRIVPAEYPQLYYQKLAKEYGDNPWRSDDGWSYADFRYVEILISFISINWALRLWFWIPSRLRLSCCRSVVQIIAIGRDLCCLRCSWFPSHRNFHVADTILCRMGWGLTLTFLPWGNRFKAHRALLQRGFTKSNVVQYQNLQEQEARQAVSSMARKPDEWETLLRR
jgi:hypothetical protein